MSTPLKNKKGQLNLEEMFGMKSDVSPIMDVMSRKQERADL